MYTVFDIISSFGGKLSTLILCFVTIPNVLFSSKKFVNYMVKLLLKKEKSKR